METQTHRHSFDMTWTAQKTTLLVILLLLGVFDATETCLTSLCLAMIWGDTHTDTQTGR
jgi:hypothetical protein